MFDLSSDKRRFASTAVTLGQSELNFSIFNTQIRRHMSQEKLTKQMKLCEHDVYIFSSFYGGF